MTALAAALASARSAFSLENPGAVARIAALAFFLLAVAGAMLVLSQPALAHWAGVVLLLLIALAGVLLLAAAWPRRNKDWSWDMQHAAAAAAASNVAWAVTAKDGAVLECNIAYRFLAGAGEGEPPAPPQLAFVGEGPAAVLYRLSRAALEGRAREETFETETGQKLSVSVRPLKAGDAAWWFTPRLPEAAPPKSALSEPRPVSALIRFTDFFRHAPVGVAITTPEGGVVEHNGAFADFFGLTTATGMLFGDMLAPTARSAAVDAVAQAAQGDGYSEPVEVHAAHAPARTAMLYASPFASAPDGERRAILYVIDTSERKALETQFAQSQKMQAVGQLAGGVAHDFNNLLTVIIGNCDLLLMRHPAGDPSFSEINEVHQNAVRAAGLVRQLLAFSRKQTLQPKVLSLPDTLSELSILLRRLLGERVSLQFEQAQDLWPVRADESQLANAIINLAVNARDAMPPEGGTVLIRTSNVTIETPRMIGTATMPAGDYVLMDVADTGSGIAPEHLSKIFEPFFTTKSVGQGTGLGLSTVYGIVKQTGGFIIVESTPGKGTVFRIYLPRYMAGASAAIPEEEDAAGLRDVTGQDTILLVEDEDAVRSFAARALRMRGYNVMEANGGEVALDIVRSHAGTIDLLISDVVMPNMDGPTLVRAARRLRPEMRIIFMSGYAEDAFRRSKENFDDMHFLPKPFGLKQLAAKVKEVLSGAPPARLSESLPEREN
jgi:signal transduction histidine kinase/ActR/RegA family two-component response regulator